MKKRNPVKKIQAVINIMINSILAWVKVKLKLNRNLIIIQIIVGLITLCISLWMAYQMMNKTQLYLSFVNTGWEGERTYYKVLICNSGTDVAKDVQVIILFPDSLESSFTCIGIPSTYYENNNKGSIVFCWRLPDNPLYMPVSNKEPYSVLLEPKIEIRPAALKRDIKEFSVEYFINHSKGSIHKKIKLKIEPPK
jgi:hypothetical protein